jgi:hypothetical protein
MGRVRCVDVGGMIYHALNRANFRSWLFKKAAHFEHDSPPCTRRRKKVPDTFSPLVTADHNDFGPIQQLGLIQIEFIR